MEGSAYLSCCQCREGFSIRKCSFTLTVTQFQTGLGGIATGEQEVQLVIYQRYLIPYCFRFVEILTEGTEFNDREDRPIHHLDSSFHISASRAAAVVTNTVNDQSRLQTAASLRNINGRNADFRRNTAVVPMLFTVAKQFLARRTSPTVKRLLTGKSTAMVVILHTAAHIDFGNIAAVSEGVGREIHFQ